MNLGILGGTFDPIHLGHLGIAKAAMDQAALGRVLFIPAGQPRLKQATPVASVMHRIEMARLAIKGNAEFQVCEMEACRPGPTYSVDTLEQISVKMGIRANLFFILGLDVLSRLDEWRNPERVLELCSLLVVGRPGEQDFDWFGFYQRFPQAKGKVHILTVPLLDLSATEIRDLVFAGEPLTGLVPEVVADYINKQGLYLQGREGRTVS